MQRLRISSLLKGVIIIRRVGIALTVLVCLACLTSGCDSSESGYVPYMPWETCLKEMDYAFARLANNDPTFDLDAFERDVVRLRSSGYIPFEVELAQCRWVVGVDYYIPGRHDLKAIAARLTNPYGDAADMARIVHMVAYGQMSHERGFEMLTALLNKQLNRRRQK